MTHLIALGVDLDHPHHRKDPRTRACFFFPCVCVCVCEYPTDTHILNLVFSSLLYTDSLPFWAVRGIKGSSRPPRPHGYLNFYRALGLALPPAGRRPSSDFAYSRSYIFRDGRSQNQKFYNVPFADIRIPELP